jgi:hypothetical protein
MNTFRNWGAFLIKISNARNNQIGIRTLFSIVVRQKLQEFQEAATILIIKKY